MYLCMYVCEVVNIRMPSTAILIIIEGLFQAFQRKSNSKLVLKTVASRFATLVYYENGSNSPGSLVHMHRCVCNVSVVAYVCT